MTPNEVERKIARIKEFYRGPFLDKDYEKAIIRADNDIHFLLTELESARACLKLYADKSNWGNGGFEGEHDTIWRGPMRLRGYELANQALNGGAGDGSV